MESEKLPRIAERQMLDYQTDCGPKFLAADCELLEQSDLFNRDFYRAQAGLGAGSNPAEHYLLEGWKLGIEPGDNFDGSFLYPYFKTVGLEGPPAITFIGLRAAGWNTYSLRAQAEHMAAVFRASGFFDAKNYAERLGLPEDIDPALHYVIVGEESGYAPSDRFDPVFYSERYPDVKDAGLSCLGHYLNNGRHEHRRPVSTVSTLTFDASRLKRDRETVLVVSHEASRTGAPILAYNIAVALADRYNIVSVLMRGGPLIDDFANCSAAVVGPLSYLDWHHAEAKRLVERLAAFGPISYAVVNSIESRYVISPLVKSGIPAVLLVHEFASYTRPYRAMSEALEWATQMVFSADVTVNSAVQELPTLSNRKIHMLRQGRCILPGARQTTAEESAILRSRMLPKGWEGALVVLGGGSIQIRKGVDLFLSCAAAVTRLAPKRRVRFVWIGHGYDPVNDVAYSSYLAEQIARSGLEDIVAMVDEVTDLDPAYENSGIFLLSSRLDPFPNVTIDAALHGLPIVCFEGSTGIASLLKADSALRKCVVPYLDVHAAARVIADFADDEGARLEVAKATKRFGEKMFNMQRYVDQIDDLGRQGIDIIRQRALDFATLNDDELFDADIFMPHHSPAIDRPEAIQDFLTRWIAVGMSLHGVKNARFRRPFPGFNPQIYARKNADRFDSAIENPLAHFIRSGKPDGPWCHEVIMPPDDEEASPQTRRSALLHVHLFYPELALDLCQKLTVNQARCDLFLTTTDDKKAESIRTAISEYRGGSVKIQVLANRGRDIGAFLNESNRETFARYDVVGHLHGKRSLVLGDSASGEIWREFLWQNLLGSMHPMMDIVLARFAAKPRLGLVFPEDPYLSGWGENFDIASGLARQIGIREPLDDFFEFPVGTMFWARVEALAPLFDLKLGWDQYPPEPVPYDGTILHAIERLLPFVARHAGYGYATTHIPGIGR